MQYQSLMPTGLMPHYEPGIHAPFVLESRVSYALTLKEMISITCNDTLLIVGEVVFIDIEDNLLANDGGIDLAQAGTLASTALNSSIICERNSSFLSLAFAVPTPSPGSRPSSES